MGHPGRGALHFSGLAAGALSHGFPCAPRAAGLTTLAPSLASCRVLPSPAQALPLQRTNKDRLWFTGGTHLRELRASSPARPWLCKSWGSRSRGRGCGRAVGRRPDCPPGPPVCKLPRSNCVNARGACFVWGIKVPSQSGGYVAGPPPPSDRQQAKSCSGHSRETRTKRKAWISRMIRVKNRSQTGKLEWFQASVSRRRKTESVKT